MDLILFCNVVQIVYALKAFSRAEAYLGDFQISLMSFFRKYLTAKNYVIYFRFHINVFRIRDTLLMWVQQSDQLTEAYSELCQTSKVERFADIVNDFYSLITFAKRSILDVWQSFEYASVNCSDC